MIFTYKYDHLPGTEQTIINGCLAGNRSSQEKLFNRYSPKMLAICLRYAKNRDEANEILLDGFFRVFKNLQQFNHSGSFEGWIRRIIVNAAIQRYKSRSNLHLVIPIDLVENEIPDEMNIYSTITTKEMIQLIQKLPTSYRMVFNLYVFDGYKHKEIAALLEIAEGTSKSNLFDARAILRQAILENNRFKTKKVR